MAAPNQAQFLAHAGNADVKKYVDAGGDFNQWWQNHGVKENRQWQTPADTSTAAETASPAQTVGDAPKPAYTSLYHEMRGVYDPTNTTDYSKTAVSTAPFQNAGHYINKETGDASGLYDAMRTGGFRFNPDFYAASNPDLAAAGIDTAQELMEHYANFGYKEGRAPGIEAPIYVNDTQTQEQAAAGYDPIAAKLISQGGTPAWGTSGFGFGTAEGHGAGTGTDAGSKAGQLSAEISEILSRGNFNDNVQDNIADVIAADSRLMKLAEGRARQFANQRGMLNSSMAVNAGQDAVLNVAMPIGSQQASQNFQANENLRGFGYQSALLGQELDWRGDQASLDRQQQLTLQNNDIGFRSAEASLDRQLQERLQTWNLNATEADNAARQMYGAQSLLQNTLVNINANTNLNAEQRTEQISRARADFDMMMALIEQLFRVDLDWSDAA